MKIYLLKRKYSTGTGPGPNDTRVSTFSTAVFMSGKKEDLDYDFNVFHREGIRRNLIPELWDKLVEGEVTKFYLVTSLG